MGFFKAYDMRGTFGVDFDLDTVYRVGRELPGVIGAKRFLVGRDCRQTSPQVAAVLMAGLAEGGAEADEDFGEDEFEDDGFELEPFTDDDEN